MYTAKISHFEGSPGILELDATTDEQAKAEINKIVSDGYRNGTTVSTTLANGDAYIATNKHGEVVSQTVDSYFPC